MTLSPHYQIIRIMNCMFVRLLGYKFLVFTSAVTPFTGPFPTSSSFQFSIHPRIPCSSLMSLPHNNLRDITETVWVKWTEYRQQLKDIYTCTLYIFYNLKVEIVHMDL